jgi:hypothetical protein
LLNLKGTWILSGRLPILPGTGWRGQQLMATEQGGKGAMGAGWPLSSLPLGRGVEVAPLGAVGGALEVSPSLGMFLQTTVRV